MVLGIVFLVIAALLVALLYKGPVLRTGRNWHGFSPVIAVLMLGFLAIGLTSIVSSGGGSKAAAAGSPITARFTASPGSALNMTFDASATSDTKGTITTYTWNFGDGTTDTGKVVNHPYKAANTYKVTMTASDNHGRDAQLTVPETVTNGGTAAKPLSGNEGNTNPVLTTVQSWSDLVQAAGNNTSYQTCLVDRIGVSWSQAQQYATLVGQGHDLRAILVSDSSVSDAQARAMLAAKGILNVQNLPVIRVNGFSNTRGLPTNGCQAFQDNRSQVRLLLTVPKSVAQVSQMAAGVVPLSEVDTSRGVLGMCSNPARFGVPTVAPCTSNCTPSRPCGCTSTKPSCTSGCKPTTPSCTSGCTSTPPPCNCTTKNQVQIPVQEPGEPTVANPNAPSSAPATHPAGPGAGQAPPSSPSSNGYDPTGGKAPGGGSSNGGSTTVNPPKPDPTPSQAVPTTDPPFSGNPGQPG